MSLFAGPPFSGLCTPKSSRVWMRWDVCPTSLSGILYLAPHGPLTLLFIGAAALCQSLIQRAASIGLDGPHQIFSRRAEIIYEEHRVYFKHAACILLGA